MAQPYIRPESSVLYLEGEQPLCESATGESFHDPGIFEGSGGWE
jgi:hypothetical protein